MQIVIFHWAGWGSLQRWHAFSCNGKKPIISHLSKLASDCPTRFNSDARGVGQFPFQSEKHIISHSSELASNLKIVQRSNFDAGPFPGDELGCNGGIKRARNRWLLELSCLEDNQATIKQSSFFPLILNVLASNTMWFLFEQCFLARNLWPVWLHGSTHQ